MNKKLLVIVPYRDREEHLKQFIPYIHKVLDEQKIEHSVLVVEQDHGELFNRGLLLNIGFKEYACNFDYVCFHDVDMIGLSIDYSYSDIPLCLLRHRSKFANVYPEYFGGITIFPTKIFETINGFSNNYWGWGCEDDDLRLRCIKSNIAISYRDGHCKDLELVTDNDNRNNNPHYKINLQKLQKYRKATSDIINQIDGLNQCHKYFTTKSIDSSHNFIHLKINANDYHRESTFVFSSVGSELPDDYKQKTFQSWNLDMFDSGCVVYNNNFPYNNYFKHTLTKTGFKFPNFFFFDEKSNIVDNYEYICVLDDDLLFKEPNSINEAVLLMKKFDISLCSLSNNSKGKKATYSIMGPENADKPKIAITNFCEMGCMIFKNTFLELCKQEYYNKYPKLTDWGFDWFICSLAQQYNLNIGIVKHLSFSNPIQHGRNLGYSDWINYKDKITYIYPTEYRSINVKY